MPICLEVGWTDGEMKITINIPEGMGDARKTCVPIPSGILFVSRMQGVCTVWSALFLCHSCQGELTRLSVEIFHQGTFEDVAFFGDG